MMSHKQFVRAVASLALAVCAAACGPSGPPGAEDILASAEAMVSPEPGLYRSVSRLERFELPHATPQEAARLRTMMDGLEPQESTTCLTSADAEEGFAAVLREVQQGDCTITEFSANEQYMRARMECRGAAGAISEVVMAGQGTTTSSRMQLDVEQTSSAVPGGTLQMRFAVSNRRIGEC